MRILLCYKNFSKETSVSHIGLGVTAAYTAKTLIKNGMHAEATPIYGTDDLTLLLTAAQNSDHPVTHVVIMAQWLITANLARMCRKFPMIRFALNCHSNVAFLQAEPPAINLVRQAIDLETGLPNFRAASNNLRLCMALQNSYNRPITYLPNLYYLHGQEHIHKPRWNGGLLRIGIFGSARVYKNFSTAVLAGVELCNRLGVQGEIWMNSGRHDGAGNVVYRTAVAWTQNLPNITLKELPWASWPEFKRCVNSMNLLTQVSFTETFNNVTADGIAEGTCSVVGPSIEWVPKSWHAEPDDSSEVASVGRRLLFDPHAAGDGYRALSTYVQNGIPYWKDFTGH